MRCNNSDTTFLEIKFLLFRSNDTNDTNDSSDSNDRCFFRRPEPTILGFAIYAFIVPSLAIFGLCANFINAIVFMRPKMTPSAFTYLAALSWLDCLSCLFITLTALSRSIFFDSPFWLSYDLKWQTSLFSITTGAANLVLACVSLDRLVYLWQGIPNGTPRFCRRSVAQRMVISVIIISCIVNIPYFFVFIVNDDGTFQTTDFYYSQYYKIHNWFTFILLAILPAIFLLVGNAAILIAFRRWTKQSKRCQSQCNTSGKNTQKRYHHQMKLTITILIVISLYLIGELPAHLTSRKSALNLLYSGDVTKVDLQVIERLEVICMALNALQLSMNIMVYALINPSFMPEFFACLRSASDTCFRVFCCCNVLSDFFKSCRKQKRKNNNSTGQTNDCDDWSDAHAHQAVLTPSAKDGNCNDIKFDFNYCKRSSSLGGFAFDNHCMEYDENFENVLKNRSIKRHSMPAYLRT